MYQYSYDQLEEYEGFTESREGESFRDSDDEQFTDQEEIEQALYAQIHYYQDTDDKHSEDKNSELEEIKQNQNKVQVLDSSFDKQSLKDTNKIEALLGIDTLTSKGKSIKQKNKLSKSTKSKSNKSVVEDEVIVIHSQSSDVISIGSEIDNNSDTPASKVKSIKQKSKLSGLKKSKSNKMVLEDDDILVINSQSSDLDEISVGSEKDENSYDDLNEIDSDSSYIEYDIDSDCMVLDEACDNMGDIILNINESQRKMVENLTVRKMKDNDEADKWSILDRDKFLGNPLLGRYYKPMSVRCHNCNEVGHLSKVCPKPKKVIVCYLCGGSGHSGKSCKNPICFNCNKPGHVSADCTGPRRSRYKDCPRCQMLGHNYYECPDIWRQFHLTTNHGPLVRGKKLENSRKNCSNCAGEDHFNFECEDERMDRYCLPSYPFISQYRKSDIKEYKRKREHTEDLDQNPTKKRKTENDDFVRSSFNIKETINHRKSTEKKQKGKKEKVENFRKMMDEDYYLSPETKFSKRSLKPYYDNQAKKKKEKKKKKDKKKTEKKISDKSKRKSVDKGHKFEGSSTPKKKKKKSKKDKTNKVTYPVNNSNRGFKMNNGHLQITIR